MVYIAGPYTNPDPLDNTRRAIDAAEALLAVGLVTPVIPHLTALWHLVRPHDLEFWYEYDLAILKRCDALLRLPGPSTGADREVTYAQGIDVPVFDDEESLHAWAHAR